MRIGILNCKKFSPLVILICSFAILAACHKDETENLSSARVQQSLVDSCSTLPSSFGATIQSNGNVYLLGGWSESGMHRSVLSIENGGQVIKKIIDVAPWAGRSYFPAISVNEGIYIFGGFRFLAPSNVLGDIWFSKDLRNWELKAIDSAWEKREAHGAVYKDGSFFLFGGVTYFRPEKSTLLGRKNTSKLRLFGDVWRSEDGFNWKMVTKSTPWGPRRSFSYAVKDGYIWLWGGINDETGQLFNDVWRSIDGAHWELVTNQAPWSPRMVNNHIGIFKNKFWVIGGGGDPKKVSGLNDVWSSDDGNEWDLITDNADFSPRNGAYVFTMMHDLKELIGIFGGLNDYNDIKDANMRSRIFYRDLYVSEDAQKWQRIDYIVKNR
jgi:hypothetical protein